MTDDSYLVLATPCHARLFAALHEKVFEGLGTAPWDEASFAALLARPGVFAFLALSAGDPKGFVLAQLAGDQAEIVTLGVIPEARRQGMGGRLVAETAHHAGISGASALFLEVAADNPAAISLYEEAGFSCVGHRKGYYTRHRTGEKADALVMRYDIV